MARTIAIGDIHGCAEALDAVLRAIEPTGDDTLLPLGDYVDRGDDSRGVLDRLIELSQTHRVVPLLGNHEEMMLAARERPVDLRMWLECGGAATLESYGPAAGIESVPAVHFDFLAACRDYYATDMHAFLHANYRPDVPLENLDVFTLRWLSLRDYVPAAPHASGRVAIVGHTPQPDGEVLDLGYLKCIDTGCCRGGWLTAMCAEDGTLWQADAAGRLRSAE